MDSARAKAPANMPMPESDDLLVAGGGPSSPPRMRGSAGTGGVSAPAKSGEEAGPAMLPQDSALPQLASSQTTMVIFKWCRSCWPVQSRINKRTESCLSKGCLVDDDPVVTVIWPPETVQGVPPMLVEVRTPPVRGRGLIFAHVYILGHTGFHKNIYIYIYLYF